MATKIVRKSLASVLSAALLLTMCPAAGLAYAAESANQPAGNSTEASSQERVNQDVSLKGGAEVSSPAQGGGASTNNTGEPGVDESQNGTGDDIFQPTEPDLSDAGSTNSSASAKYTSTTGGRISADVSLKGEATVGTIEYNGLAYTINEDDTSSVSVTGLAVSKPTGDVQIPTQIANAGKLYTVSAIDVYGIAKDTNPYAENIFENKDKALSVKTLTIPASIGTINPAFFQLFPNATDIYIDSNNTSYTSFDGAIYDSAKTQLILVPQGKGSLVLPQQLATVPAYVFSQCNKLSAITFEGATGSDNLAVWNNSLYTSDLTTLLAAPAGLGASVSISPECTTIAEGAFFGNEYLETIVVNGVVEEIAKAGDSAQDAKGSALLTNSTVGDTTLPAFSDAVVNTATVVINLNNSTDEDAAALLEKAKSSWESYGFSNFKEPPTPGTIVKPVSGSGFEFTLLNDYTLSVSWVGNETAPAALDIPDYGVIDGVYYTVSTIADSAFAYEPNIVTVDVPSTVTTIGNSAFKSCTNLQTIHFDSVVTIGEEAFETTSLLSLVLPTTVQTLGANALSSIKDATIVALGYIPNNSEIALGGSKGLKVYVPLGTEDSWDAGIPAYGNHIYPYGIQLSKEAINLDVGQSANITDGGYIKAPGDIETNYAYKANPISINQETGEVEAKAEGSTYINVSLNLTINQVVVKHQNSQDVKLKSVATSGSESSNVVSAPQQIELASANMNAVTYAVAAAETSPGITIDMFDFSVVDEANRTASIKVKGGKQSQLTGTLIIPSTCTISGKTYTVTVLAQYGFANCNNITSVMIPATIELIDYAVFQGCYNLSNVSIADGVRPLTVRGLVFDTAINGYFTKNEDGSINITKMGALKEIFLPARTTLVADNFAVHASALQKISIAASNTKYTTIDGVLFSKDETEIVSIPPAYGGGKDTSYTVPSTVRTLKASTFDSSTYLKKVIIPDSVTSIGHIAFTNCFINEIWVYGKPALADVLWYNYGSDKRDSKITVHCVSSEVAKWTAHKAEPGVTSGQLGDTLVVEAIPSYDNLLDFTPIAGTTNCSVKAKADKKNEISGTLMIPSSRVIDGTIYTVTEIAQDGFSNCNNITAVSIPSTITRIRHWAFGYCYGIESVTIADGSNPLTLEGWLFGAGAEYKKDESDNYIVTRVGKLKEIFIPSRAISINGAIGVHASALEKFIVAQTNPNYTEIDGILFTKNQKEIVSFPPAYGGGAITDYTIPSTVQVIRNSTFDTNMHLKKLIVPSTVQSIGHIAFTNCYLNEFWFYGTPAVDSVLWYNYALYKRGGKITVHCIASEVAKWEAHKNEPGATGLAEILVVETIVAQDDLLDFTPISGTTNCSIKVKAGKENQLTGALIIPSTYTISGTAYTVTNIPDNAFVNCKNIVSVMVPDTVENIGTRAFSGCMALETFSIADGSRPLSIGGWAFMAGAGFSVDEEGNYILTSQNKLKELFIPARATSINGAIAVHASGLEKFIVAADNPRYTTLDGILYTKDQRKITSIPPAWGGGSVTEYSVPATVQTIANSAFDTNLFIKKVIIPDSVTYIGNIAFTNCFIDDIWVYGSPGLNSVLWDQHHKKVKQITVHCSSGDAAKWEAHKAEAGVAAANQLGSKLVIDSFTSAFNITFHGNETGNTTLATNVPGSQFIMGGNSPVAPVSDPARVGYTFGGWYKESACTTKYSFDGSSTTSNVSLYAKWTPISYTITYNKDGGVDSPANPTSYTIEQTVVLRDLTKSGYRFDGWVETTPGVTAASPAKGLTIPRVSTGNRSYEARFTLLTYNITYTLNGGTVSSANPATYNVNTNTFTLNNPAKNGYTFDGWSGTGLSAVTKTVTVTQGSTGDRAYTANFTLITYNITYSLAGGVAPTPNNPSTYNVTTNTFTLSAPTKIGYTFSGWSGTGITGTQASVTITKGSTGDKTYTAKWAANTNTPYKVEHYQEAVNGVYVVVSSDTQNLTGTTATTATATANTYSGFTENTAHANRVATGAIKGDGTLVLRLYYSRNSYSVTYNTNGGTSITSASYKHGSSWSSPTTTKTGYVLGGWYKDSALTQAFIIGTDVMPIGGITLYAKWNGATGTKYTVRYYFQNINNDSYGLDSSLTQEKTGQTRTTFDPLLPCQ